LYLFLAHFAFFSLRPVHTFGGTPKESRKGRKERNATIAKKTGELLCGFAPLPLCVK
jgi:hypothetical protein